MKRTVALAIVGLLAGCAATGCAATQEASREGRAPVADASGGAAGDTAVASAAGAGGDGAAGDGAAGDGAAGDGASGGADPDADGDGAAGSVGVDVGGAAGGASGTVVAGAAGMDARADIVCSPIADGMSSVTVNGDARTFLVNLPADRSNMALLFVWHGFAQEPGTFANEVVYDVPAGRWVPFDPNAFAMPLMLVTPVDVGLLPPMGLDWDIEDGSQDFPFFEGMLQCIEEQFTVDEERIYSFGFSAGAVFTNMLSARYPDLFAATISESGAWFNDQAQWSDVLIPAVQWVWPDFDAADGGNVLLTHGGPMDFATIISLESANTKARPFLLAHGRTVVDCVHDFGHTLAPDLTQTMLYDYMWSHRRGGPALSSLPAGLPTPANPVGSTTCTFHAP